MLVRTLVVIRAKVSRSAPCDVISVTSCPLCRQGAPRRAPVSKSTVFVPASGRPILRQTPRPLHSPPPALSRGANTEVTGGPAGPPCTRDLHERPLCWLVPRLPRAAGHNPVSIRSGERGPPMWLTVDESGVSWSAVEEEWVEVVSDVHGDLHAQAR